MPDNSQLIMFGGSVFLIMAVFMALGLIWPRIGTWAMGALWPGRFADPHQRRLATRYWLVLLSGFGLMGLSFLMMGLQSLHRASNWLNVQSMLVVLAVLCFSMSWRFQRKLPLAPSAGVIRKQYIQLLILGGIGAVLGTLVIMVLYRNAVIRSGLAHALIVGLSLICFTLAMIYLLWMKDNP